MADYSLGLALGYGRERAGRVGTGVGFNAYKIFTGKYIETGATMRKTGETHMLPTTQNHWSMEGRPAVREANLDEFPEATEISRRRCHDEGAAGGRVAVSESARRGEEDGVASMGHGD